MPCLLPLAFWRRAAFKSFPLVCAPLPSSRKHLQREQICFETEGCNVLDNECISDVLVAKPTLLGCSGAPHPSSCLLLGFAGESVPALLCLLLGFQPLCRATFNPVRPRKMLEELGLTCPPHPTPRVQQLPEPSLPPAARPPAGWRVNPLRESLSSPTLCGGPKPVECGSLVLPEGPQGRSRCQEGLIKPLLFFCSRRACGRAAAPSDAAVVVWSLYEQQQ